MLQHMKSLQGMTIDAADGQFGSVSDVYFDEEAWGVRYLVATEATSINRKFLISTRAILFIEWRNEIIHINLTQQQLKDSPEMGISMPLSRQEEMQFHKYYGYPFYWSGPYLWGFAPNPIFPAAHIREVHIAEGEPECQAKPDEPVQLYLCCASGVAEYHVEATDDEIGHIKDCLIDDKTWAIRYIEVETAEHDALIPREWINTCPFAEEHRVHIAVERNAVETSPGYNTVELLSPDDEMNLHRHYSIYGSAVHIQPQSTGSLHL